MKYYQPKYYNDFRCISSDCTDTCCRHWQVELDDESFVYYKNLKRCDEVNLPKGFLTNGIITKSFKIKSDGDCIFLGKDLLCNLYCKVGHDNLPATCRLYPRFINNFGGYEERGLSFSCPEAARYILSNDIDLADYSDNAPIENFVDIDAEMFLALKKSRSVLFDYIDAETDVFKMFSGLINSGEILQRYLNDCDYKKILAFTIPENELFCDCDFNEIYAETLKCHKKYKRLRPGWETDLDSSKFSNHFENMCEIKIWLKYFVFRYLLKGVFDKKVSDKLCAAVCSALIIFSLELPTDQALQRYCKETEHNSYNIKRLFIDSNKICLNNSVDK